MPKSSHRLPSFDHSHAAALSTSSSIDTRSVGDDSSTSKDGCKLQMCTAVEIVLETVTSLPHTVTASLALK